MKSADLFSAVAVARVAAAVAVAVGVVAGVCTSSSAGALSAATPASGSSTSPIVDVEGLLLALPEPDGVDVGVGVLGCEGRGEGC